MTLLFATALPSLLWLLLAYVQRRANETRLAEMAEDCRHYSAKDEHAGRVRCGAWHEQQPIQAEIEFREWVARHQALNRPRANFR